MDKKKDGKTLTCEANDLYKEKNLLFKKSKRKQITIDEPNKNKLYLYVD
jgi:hypothetical protein